MCRLTHFWYQLRNGSKIWHPRNLTVVHNPATVLLPCCLCEDLLFMFLSVLYIFMCMCSVLGEGSIFIMVVLAAYYWCNLDFVWMYKFSEYSEILFSRAIWVIETFTKICWWKLRMQLNWKKNHTRSDPSRNAIIYMHPACYALFTHMTTQFTLFVLFPASQSTL